ncbi:MAG: hypothetical protein RMA76_27805 [Deltaproteobacteria bacterium]
MKLRLPIALLLAALPATAAAQDVEITLTQQAKDVLGDELQVAEDQLEELVRQRFREAYRLVDVQDFLRVSANAQALANKGLGVDYAASPKIAMFGVAISAAAESGDADLDDITNPQTVLSAGAGAQISAMGGLNLGIIGLSRLTLFANGLYHPWTVNDLDGEFYNIGAHVQYALIRPKSAAVIEWRGIDLTSGVEISRMVLSLSDTQDSAAPIRVDGREYEIRSTATGTLRLEQTAFNIPIEATTGITILKLVSVYGGVGVDFMSGGAKLNADLDATMEADDPRDTTQTLDVGTARVSAAEEGAPNTVFYRALVGAQIHLGPLNVFGQVNLGLNDVAVAVAAGLRLSI